MPSTDQAIAQLLEKPKESSKDRIKAILLRGINEIGVVETGYFYPSVIDLREHKDQIIKGLNNVPKAKLDEFDNFIRELYKN